MEAKNCSSSTTVQLNTEYNAGTYDATCVPLLKHAFKTQLTTCFKVLKIYSMLLFSEG
jgi:hypothetical protein